MEQENKEYSLDEIEKIYRDVVDGIFKSQKLSEVSLSKYKDVVESLNKNIDRDENSILNEIGGFSPDEYARTVKPFLHQEMTSEAVQENLKIINRIQFLGKMQDILVIQPRQIPYAVSYLHTYYIKDMLATQGTVLLNKSYNEIYNEMEVIQTNEKSGSKNLYLLYNAYMRVYDFLSNYLGNHATNSLKEILAKAKSNGQNAQINGWRMTYVFSELQNRMLSNNFTPEILDKDDISEVDYSYSVIVKGMASLYAIDYLIQSLADEFNAKWLHQLQSVIFFRDEPYTFLSKEVNNLIENILDKYNEFYTQEDIAIFEKFTKLKNFTTLPNETFEELKVIHADDLGEKSISWGVFNYHDEIQRVLIQLNE